MLLPLVRTKKHVDSSSSSARRWRGGLPSVRRRTGATRRLPGPLYIKVCASRYCYGARTSGMRLDETLQAQLVTSQGSPYPSRSPKRRLVSYTPLAPLAAGTAFIYLDVFDRAVDICRQRGCANCCSIPALAELDTALLRCSLSSTLLASAAQVQHIHGSAHAQRPPQRRNTPQRKCSGAIRVEARRPPHRRLPRGALLLALER